jgi:hypothetical protein
MLPISNVASASFQFSFFNPQLETRNQQPALALELVTRTISIGNIKKHKVIIEPDTKRCAAEDVLLRTFCSFPAQGLGEWCAGLVWELDAMGPGRKFDLFANCEYNTRHD